MGSLKRLSWFCFRITLSQQGLSNRPFRIASQNSPSIIPSSKNIKRVNTELYTSTLSRYLGLVAIEAQANVAERQPREG
jgi:hypothetical protein